MDSRTGAVSTTVGAQKYCLGYSKNVSAFGGAGSAAVALPCGDHQTAWTLDYPSPRNGTGALLRTTPGVPCLVGTAAACSAEKAKSVTIAAAKPPAKP